MNPSFQLDNPDRVTVGTVGPAGQRTFFVQASEGRRVLTLKVEKEQVRQLAEFLATILEDLAPDADAADSGDLESPIEQDWVVGTIRVAPYDEDADRVHLLFEEFVPGDENEEAPAGASARVSLTPEQVVRFVRRALALVAAGRETCILCGNPKDPAGHACPKTNGHAG